MIGYATPADISSLPPRVLDGSVVDRWFSRRKSFLARVAKSVLRVTAPEKPRSKCLVTSFLTRVAAWDTSSDSIKTKQPEARKRRLIILRFNGD